MREDVLTVLRCVDDASLQWCVNDALVYSAWTMSAPFFLLTFVAIWMTFCTLNISNKQALIGC